MEENDTAWTHSGQDIWNGQAPAASARFTEHDGSGRFNWPASWPKPENAEYPLADQASSGNGTAVHGSTYVAGSNVDAQQSGNMARLDHSNPAYVGTVPSTSEAGVLAASTTQSIGTVEDNINVNISEHSAPQAPWSQPPLGKRLLSRTRKNLAPTGMDGLSPLMMDTLFVTPERSASERPTDPLPYHKTPTASTKKRKAGPKAPLLQIPDQSQVEQFAPPIPLPPTAGIFGSQARGLRAGQRRSVQVDQPSTPSKEVLAQLQEIPDLLCNGMTELMQIVKELARKHTTLEKRVYELERENRALKGLPSTPPPAQQDADANGYSGEGPHAQDLVSEDVSANLDSRPRKKRNTSAMPMPGEAYGGPLHTQPSKSPGIISGMITNNRQTAAAPCQSPQTPRAPRRGFRPLKPLSAGAAAMRDAFRDS